MASKRVAPAATMPQSWAAKNWPDWVFPGRNPHRVRKLLKTHRAALLAHGALARVGRDLIVFGAGYGAWLAAHTSNVAGYQCPANAARKAA